MSLNTQNDIKIMHVGQNKIITDTTGKISIPVSKSQQIIDEMHTLLLHPAINKLANMFKNHFKINNLTSSHTTLPKNVSNV